MPQGNHYSCTFQKVRWKAVNEGYGTRKAMTVGGLKTGLDYEEHSVERPHCSVNYMTIQLQTTKAKANFFFASKQQGNLQTAFSCMRSEL